MSHILLGGQARVGVHHDLLHTPASGSCPTEAKSCLTKTHFTPLQLLNLDL